MNSQKDLAKLKKVFDYCFSLSRDQLVCPVLMDVPEAQEMAVCPDAKVNPDSEDQDPKVTPDFQVNLDCPDYQDLVDQRANLVCISPNNSSGN